jgi:hypothetical protein
MVSLGQSGVGEAVAAKLPPSGTARWTQAISDRWLRAKPEIVASEPHGITQITILTTTPTLRREIIGGIVNGIPDVSPHCHIRADCVGAGGQGLGGRVPARCRRLGSGCDGGRIIQAYDFDGTSNIIGVLCGSNHRVQPARGTYVIRINEQQEFTARGLDASPLGMPLTWPAPCVDCTYHGMASLEPRD